MIWLSPKLHLQSRRNREQVGSHASPSGCDKRAALRIPSGSSAGFKVRRISHITRIVDRRVGGTRELLGPRRGDQRTDHGARLTPFHRTNHRADMAAVTPARSSPPVSDEGVSFTDRHRILGLDVGIPHVGYQGRHLRASNGANSVRRFSSDR